MQKLLALGFAVSLLTACTDDDVAAPLGPVEDEIARLEAELAAVPGELVITRAADLPFSEELEHRIATAGKVIHVFSDDRVAAYVGTAQTALPEGVPERRTFSVHGGDVVVAEQALLSAYLELADPAKTEHANATGLVIGDGKQWPHSTVAYTINANITGADRAAVVNAITLWNLSSDAAGTQVKVRFVPRYAGDWRPYVDFVKGGLPAGACGMSHVGRADNIFTNWFSHSINIGEGCFSMRTITHEMGHTAGLNHEHQRCDRTNFVAVDQADPVNCDAICGGDSIDFGPYNYLSVMHYGYGACMMRQIVPATTNFRGSPSQAGTAALLDVNDVQGLNQSYVTRPGLPQIGPGRFFSFVPAYTSKVLAIPASMTTNNLQAVLFDRLPGAFDQHFTLLPVGEGFVTIRPRHAPSKCLEPMNFGTANNTPVVQFTCDNHIVQHWIVAPNAGAPGTVDVINRLTGKSLDVAGWGTANGTGFQQFDHTNNTNQRFTLSPAF